MSIDIEQIVDNIINGMSLREAGRIYQIDRDTLKSKCMEYFMSNPERLHEFQEALKNNKKTINRIEISDQTLKEICESICDRKDTLRNIASNLSIDEGTLREKINEFLCKSENKELLKRYMQYQNSIHPDYSHINFKALAVEMLRSGLSQSQLAAEYEIPIRTMSREMEKLKDEEKYQKLYYACKGYADKKMKKQKLTQFEKILIEMILMEYDDEGPILVENGKSKKQIQYEKAKQNIEAASKIEGTEQEKAKALGIGVSTLRRNRILVKQFEEDKEGRDIGDE